jgi:beta-glucanase (GH16 family)
LIGHTIDLDRLGKFIYPKYFRQAGWRYLSKIIKKIFLHEKSGDSVITAMNGKWVLWQTELKQGLPIFPAEATGAAERRG